MTKKYKTTYHQCLNIFSSLCAVILCAYINIVGIYAIIPYAQFTERNLSLGICLLIFAKYIAAIAKIIIEFIILVCC